MQKRRALEPSPEREGQRTAWQRGIDDAWAYLRGSTFSAPEMDTVDACLALLKELRANLMWGPNDDPQPKPEPGGEVCQECGHAYDYVYSVPYEIWARISPKPAPAGLLCPACALNKIAASSQNVRAGEDAARYRWLRDNFMYTQDDKTSTACIYIPYGVELGAAIDAAMREQEGKS